MWILFNDGAWRFFSWLGQLACGLLQDISHGFGMVVKPTCHLFLTLICTNLVTLFSQLAPLLAASSCFGSSWRFTQ